MEHLSRGYICYKLLLYKTSLAFLIPILDFGGLIVTEAINDKKNLTGGCYRGLSLVCVTEQQYVLMFFTRLWSVRTGYVFQVHR